jgi:cytochrome c peroxidase/DNA-binding beta-propeller fold protein YncE
VPVGDEPSAVVIAPDDKVAYVALKAEARVVRVVGIDGSSPSVSGSVEVGSEPVGLALSPRGDRLVVTEWAEGRVALIDTKNLSVIGSKAIPNPRGVAISNNGDQSDADEKVVVTEFYGRPGPAPEAGDNSRTGAVRILRLGDLSEVATVLFEPTATGDAGFPAQTTSPNQLYSVAVAGNKFFATAIGASPDGAPVFNGNVFPLVLVGDLGGSKLGSISLAAAIKQQVNAPRLFMADVVDVALVGSDILYLVARGADAVQRAVLTGDTTVSLGTPTVKQLDLLVNPNNTGCQAPIGMVTPHSTSETTKAYVNCWVSRTATVIALDSQTPSKKIATGAPPAGLEAQVNKGRRFFFTGRARWANEAWSSCGSCHSDGLSDNVTWRFAAGPRQSTDMSGTFSHGPGPQKQRILNWTGIFDELHDFERDTRTVSGGKGAITTENCGNFAPEDQGGEKQVGLNPADPTDKNGVKVQLGIPVREIQEALGAALCTVQLTGGKDWDDIEAFVRTIRPPRGKRFLDAGSVSRGWALFEQAGQGNCAACHGGAGWTLSRRFYTPSDQTNKDLANTPFSAPGSPHTKQIEQEPKASGGFIAPAQVSCVLRNVGSFGIPGDPAQTDALEKKAGNPPTDRAQGEFAGYNIPSLYGLALGAPYLHHGQARTLAELFSDPKWSVHLRAGNAVFTPSAGQVQDLANFLLSIDATTSEATVPGGADQCLIIFP